MKWLCVILCVCCTPLLAQDSLKIKKLQYKGYVKDLQSLNFREDLTDLTTGNLIHHRMNLKWTPSGEITAAMEVRNRLFWGEEIALIPDYSSQLRNRNEAFDLTWNLLDRDRMILNTTIDRLWIECHRSRWNARLGRQRINWGIGTTWNPNDLFNTFNFLDFDYEERPGADGARLQYFLKEMDHVELAASFSEQSSDLIVAVKYFRNIANYDLQFIGGLYNSQPTLGFGWSGSIRESGFKGELQYFAKQHAQREQFNLVMETDHVFEKGWYVSAGAFLNSVGATQPLEMLQMSAMQFSPKNLMPTKWNTIASFAKEISPLISVNASVIFAPQTKLFLLLPSVNYNMTEDLEVNFVWQSFFIEQGPKFNDLSHRCFLRFKWSY